MDLVLRQESTQERRAATDVQDVEALSAPAKGPDDVGDQPITLILVERQFESRIAQEVETSERIEPPSPRLTVQRVGR